MRLVHAGFLPIVTVTRPWAADDGAVFDAFVATLRGAGYERPRIKMIPILKIGAEAAVATFWLLANARHKRSVR